MLAAMGFLIGRQFMYLNIDLLLFFSISQAIKLVISSQGDQSAIVQSNQQSEGLQLKRLSSNVSFGLNQSPVLESLLPSRNMIGIIMHNCMCTLFVAVFGLHSSSLK